MSSLASGTETGKTDFKPGRPEFPSQLHVAALGPECLLINRTGAPAPPRAMLCGLKMGGATTHGNEGPSSLGPWWGWMSRNSLGHTSLPRQPGPTFLAPCLRGLPSSTCLCLRLLHPRGWGAVRVMSTHEYCSQEPGSPFFPLLWGRGATTGLISQCVIRVTCPCGAGDTQVAPPGLGSRT